MNNFSASKLGQLAQSGVNGLSSPPDPLDPNLSNSFVEVLKEPMPMKAVEAIERIAIDIFRPYLADASNKNLLVAHAFADFFHSLGFLFKYKPYGVKAASPFGYSIFDLKIGHGFSFQLHLEPKYEAFHFLRCHPGSFLYLSTRPEWVEAGADAAIEWAKGTNEFRSDFSCVPVPGDVARVTSTEIVHSVVGCTLEEYATTSFDAVERLLDQNDRAGMSLPARHPDMHKMVHDLYPELPLRLLSRSGSAWSFGDMPSSQPIIDIPDQLLGMRIRLENGIRIRLPAPVAWIKVIVPTTSTVQCSFADRHWVIAPGQLFAVPPAWDAELETDHTTVVAVHAIAPQLVLRGWD